MPLHGVHLSGGELWLRLRCPMLPGGCGAWGLPCGASGRWWDSCSGFCAGRAQGSPLPLPPPERLMVMAPSNRFEHTNCTGFGGGFLWPEGLEGERSKSRVKICKLRKLMKKLDPRAQKLSVCFVINPQIIETVEQGES